MKEIGERSIKLMDFPWVILDRQTGLPTLDGSYRKQTGATTFLMFPSAEKTQEFQRIVQPAFKDLTRKEFYKRFLVRRLSRNELMYLATHLPEYGMDGLTFYFGRTKDGGVEKAFMPAGSVRETFRALFEEEATSEEVKNRPDVVSPVASRSRGIFPRSNWTGSRT